jgi:uncharacterized membrane protein YdjX (TVP38/TMEM64 family)
MSAQPETQMKGDRRKFVIRLAFGVASLLALAGAYWALRASGTLDLLTDAAALRALVAALDPWGPLVIIGLMTIAVVVSPIPSAPVAVAAGAAYGHFWGMAYVLIGAEAGAIVAFSIARFVGGDAVQRWFGDRVRLGRIGSQNALMGIVFVSRLLPFVSFDVVSYAAGLTALSFWRFALATLVGIVPASFVLAHLGGEMAQGEADRALVAILVLGALVVVPLAISLVRERRQRS